MDDQEQYEAYEDAFYQNANWPNEEQHQAEPEENPPDTKLSDDTPGDDTVEANFLTEPVQIYRCRYCAADFPLNNQLYKYLRTTCENRDTRPKYSDYECHEPEKVPLLSIDTPVVKDSYNKGAEACVFYASDVIELDTVDILQEGYAFRGHRFVTAIVMFVLAGQIYELCFDTGCTMSLIDRKFLMEVCPKIVIKKTPTPITVKGIGANTHNAREYVRLKMYIPGKDGYGTALIHREFYVVDNLAAKALVGIDIIKPEGIILDVARNLMTISSCRNIQVPITSVSNRPQTNATVFSKKIMSIPPHSNVAIPIAGPKSRKLELPPDRDFIFEPQRLDHLSVYAHVIDCNIFQVFVRNDTESTI